MARKQAAAAVGDEVLDYRHTGAKRKNIPPAGLAAQGKIAKEQKLHYAYNPHLPPRLLFDPSGKADRLQELLAKLGKEELSGSDIDELKALAQTDPWLEWSGKREEPACVVDPVALHIHERVSAQAVLKMAVRDDVPRDLFADPQEELREALRFYEHDVTWSNRMILGDSLAVMASLSRREAMAGKVQAIYCDFPYGIKYASNFQSEVGKRDVKDKPEDLTREPEMVKAYRDTWTLGVHSYLKYVRDRLVLMKELLTDSGSVFLQISDENVHRLRSLCDEVFGAEQFVAQISFVKSSGLGANLLPRQSDYLLWYSKDISRLKFRQVYKRKDLTGEGADAYGLVKLASGEVRRLASVERDGSHSLAPKSEVFRFDNLTKPGPGSKYQVSRFGREYTPGQRWWGITPDGMARALGAERVMPQGNSLSYVRRLNDFAAFPITNVWSDTGTGSGLDKVYVVQTTTQVVERCLLMTTEPGDLVLDPTLGSGTTAAVAEEWGRRWIGIDASRVALAVARQRLLTSLFSYYQLRPTSAEDIRRNEKGCWLRDPTGQIQGTATLDCITLPKITLKSIVQNPGLDSIIDHWQPVLIQKLAALNKSLSESITLQPDLPRKMLAKLAVKQKNEGKKSITDADERRWLLPPSLTKRSSYTTVKKDFSGWYEWEVPFDSDPEWPQPLRDALAEYRAAWRQKMDEVDTAISARAEQEELVDQPYVTKGVTRVSGPFTIEGVIPVEESIDLEEPSPVDEFDAELDTFEEGSEGTQVTTFAGVEHLSHADKEPANAEAYVDKMLRLLDQDGVLFTGTGNKTIKFDRLERYPTPEFHAEGNWTIDGQERSVAVVVGPQYGPMIAPMIEEACRFANRRGFDDVVFAAFSFDGAAQAVLQEESVGRINLHMAQIRPDVNMGDLLKTTTSSQIFTVSGTPRVTLRHLDGAEVQVEMQGVDIYDPVMNNVRSAGADKVAAWFLDRDYDGRTFCITQAFFPDKRAWDKLAKALTGKVDAEVFEALSGTVSLPFKPGKQVAVKVIDPRGNEVMWVKRLGGH